MDKIDQYLDQVCRSIGGPKSLRQHVRQELREHLLDAVAEHRAAGMTEELALARALEDFGGPEQVRSDLEAAHGYRVMPLVIDKAMQWKEKTMRARWLWASWAHLALVVVIALEVFWITFAEVFLVPRFQRLRHDGAIDLEALQEAGMAWMAIFLNGLDALTGRYTTYLVLLAVVAWAVFEWRVRGENKSFIRLSVLGTVAVALMVVAVLTAGSLVIPYQLEPPATRKMIARPYALEQINRIETSVRQLEQGLAKQDWDAVEEQARRASEASDRLASAGAAVGSLSGPPTIEELRAQLRSANECLLEARKAGRDKDSDALQAALRKFHERFGPVARAATSPQR
jgi:hypothetical protein